MRIDVYNQGYSSITAVPSSKRPRKLLAVASLGHSILKDHVRILAVGNLGILPAGPKARNCPHLRGSKGKALCASQLQGPVGDCYRLAWLGNCGGWFPLHKCTWCHIGCHLPSKRKQFQTSSFTPPCIRAQPQHFQPQQHLSCCGSPSLRSTNRRSSKTSVQPDMSTCKTEGFPIASSDHLNFLFPVINY